MSEHTFIEVEIDGVTYREAVLQCPECRVATLKLRASRFGVFYGCTRWPACKGSHSAHKKTGEPMGIPADVATKRARVRAHAAFDRLWTPEHLLARDPGTPPLMKRKAAYAWMAAALGMTKDEAHISRLTYEQCEKLIAAVNARLAQRV